MQKEEFFEKYLEQTIKNYLAYKSAVDEQFKKWLDLGMDIPRTAQNFLAGTTPFQSFLDQFSFSTGEQEKDKEDQQEVTGKDLSN